MNAGQALDDTAICIHQTLWLEGFGDLSEVLEAGFRKTLQTCKYWPVKVADAREHVEYAKETATSEAAERAWERVLALRRRFWNPDMPGGFSRGMPQLPPRIDRAARAAGVFRDYETVEASHVWAKKKFIESFVRWDEAEESQNLLPDGEIKRDLTDAAQRKALPAAERYEIMRARGLAYAEQLKLRLPKLQTSSVRSARRARGAVCRLAAHWKHKSGFSAREGFCWKRSLRRCRLCET